ncbi:hypothetical protein Tco_1335164 [Tanacetum coccineum]
MWHDSDPKEDTKEVPERDHMTEDEEAPRIRMMARRGGAPSYPTTLCLLLSLTLFPQLGIQRHLRLMKVARLLALPTPPPSPLTPLSSLLPQIPSPPLPVSSPPLPLPSPAIDS